MPRVFNDDFNRVNFMSVIWLKGVQKKIRSQKPAIVPGPNPVGYQERSGNPEIVGC